MTSFAENIKRCNVLFVSSKYDRLLIGGKFPHMDAGIATDVGAFSYVLTLAEKQYTKRLTLISSRTKIHGTRTCPNEKISLKNAQNLGVSQFE